MQISERTSLQEIKDIDMVGYLALLGIEPARTNGIDYWYFSPFRAEKTPSFKINRQLNRWYDHGIGQGGNLIDFGVLYYQCTVGSFLERLRGNTLTPLSRHELPIFEQPQNERKVIVLQEKTLSSPALLSYLAQRAIPADIAGKFCKEVRYSLAGKEYYAIGFQNDSGGYELRNQFSKICSSPKDITLVDNGSKDALVFEGFFDMLAYQTASQRQQLPGGNLVVLNSIALFNRARPILEAHASIQLLLDSDLAGRHLTKKALALGSRFQDASGLYQGHKDVNDWLLSASDAVQRPKIHKTIPFPGRL